MQSPADEDTLRLCLSNIINTIDKCIQKLKNQRQVPTTTEIQQQSPFDNLNDDDIFSTKGSRSTDIGKVTLDGVENELLDSLTEDIETELGECLPDLTPICFNSFTDFLHQYDYDRERQKFSSTLTKNAICSMKQELKGLLGKLTPSEMPDGLGRHRYPPGWVTHGPTLTQPNVVLR
ncbi:unnamed protein product [Rotaria magnacalcarata]|uniref:Uncharacterized protein n=1 Tax=Rotaria magnacalcarata TaxID=392030 RepID=A0A816RSJ1_9BILA|nr:unnamed protein product [Rotaria magnacalcarata]CAF3800564.1 unnamed protein product [Rotaria magnacalcarata]